MHVSSGLMKSLEHGPTKRPGEEIASVSRLVVFPFFQLSAASESILISDPVGVHTDEAMPWLSRALDPNEVERQLQTHLVSSVRDSGSVSLKAIRVTRYKAGRRCLIEYELNVLPAGGPLRALTIIGKIRAKSADKKTFSLHRKLRS